MHTNALQPIQIPFKFQGWHTEDFQEALQCQSYNAGYEKGFIKLKVIPVSIPYLGLSL